MSAPLVDIIPKPGNYGLPLARHQDLVIRLAPQPPATAWPAELESIVLIVDRPDAAPLEYEAEMTTGPVQAVIKVESEVVDTWPKNWEWSIRMNWAGAAPTYNQVPANGVTVRADGRRR